MKMVHAYQIAFHQKQEWMHRELWRWAMVVVLVAFFLFLAAVAVTVMAIAAAMWWYLESPSVLNDAFE